MARNCTWQCWLNCNIFIGFYKKAATKALQPTKYGPYFVEKRQVIEHILIFSPYSVLRSIL